MPIRNERFRSQSGTPLYQLIKILNYCNPLELHLWRFSVYPPDSERVKLFPHGQGILTVREDVYPADREEVYPADREEVYPTDREEVYPVDREEVYPTDREEVCESRLGRSCRPRGIHRRLPVVGETSVGSQHCGVAHLGAVKAGLTRQGIQGSA